MKRIISLLLVDDHAIVREGYRSLLSKQAHFKVIGEATDGAEAYQRYKELQPEVVIMDISLPGIGGLEAISRIRQRDPKAKILVFSMHQNPSYATQAIQAGAKGYVTKSSAPEFLLNAIEAVSANQLALSPDIAQALALEKLGMDQLALSNLSPREFEILRMLAGAQSRTSIAQTLKLSPKTVLNTHYLIKSKLGVSSDIELIRLAIKLKLIDPLENQ